MKVFGKEMIFLIILVLSFDSQLSIAASEVNSQAVAVAPDSSIAPLSPNLDDLQDSQGSVVPPEWGTTPGSETPQESKAPAGSITLQGSKTSEGSDNIGPAKKKSKGRKPREKEAEGTQAPNRFDPDTFIKSRYELDGQALEVDTE